MPRSGVRARSTTTGPEALLYTFDDGTLGDINSRAAAGGVTRQLITSSNSFLVGICLRLAADLYSTNGAAGRVSGRPVAVRLHCERPRMRSCALVTGDTQFILAAASSNRRAECRFIVAMLGLTACTGAPASQMPLGQTVTRPLGAMLFCTDTANDCSEQRSTMQDNLRADVVR
jgi:hypothetical protein